MLSRKTHDRNPFIGGLIGGTCGVLGSHPFDTVKTRIQTSGGSIISSARKIYSELGIKGFYRGILPPTAGFAMEKFIVFGVYENLKHLGIKNDFLCGILAGLACTSVVSPYEKIKIKMQNNSNLSLTNAIRNESLQTIYKGYTPTLVREVPGYGIYFTTYKFLKERTKNPTPLHTFMYGGLSGLSSWVFIYPSDPVKTLMQEKEYSLRESITKIYQKRGIMGFYKGFNIAMLRVIPLHAFTFLGYETFMRSTLF